MFCNKCGNEKTENAKFCNNCGSSFNIEDINIETKISINQEMSNELVIFDTQSSNESINNGSKKFWRSTIMFFFTLISFFLMTYFVAFCLMLLIFMLSYVPLLSKFENETVMIILVIIIQLISLYVVFHLTLYTCRKFLFSITKWGKMGMIVAFSLIGINCLINLFYILSNQRLYEYYGINTLLFALAAPFSFWSAYKSNKLLVANLIK